MKYRKERKIISFISCFSLLLQTFLPLTLAMPAYAEDTASDSAVVEVTPTPEITPEVTPIIEPTPEVTPEPTPEVTVTQDITPEPTDGVIPSVVLTPTPTEIIIPTPEFTSTPSIEPKAVPSPWTFEKVELNKEYVSPQNSGVKLTFTKLPENSGNIKIEEITLTPEQITQTGSLSDKAYDITSDMVDGSFAYNLSLPIPESSKGKSVDIKFAEDILQIDSAQKVDNTTNSTDTSVFVTNLDHFTIFVVTAFDGVNITPVGTNFYTVSSGITATYTSGTGTEIDPVKLTLTGYAPIVTPWFGLTWTTYNYVTLGIKLPAGFTGAYVYQTGIMRYDVNPIGAYKMSSIGDGSTPLATAGAALGYLDYSFAANSTNTTKDGLVKLQVIWTAGGTPEYFTIDISNLSTLIHTQADFAAFDGVANGTNNYTVSSGITATYTENNTIKLTGYAPIVTPWFGPTWTTYNYVTLGIKLPAGFSGTPSVYRTGIMRYDTTPNAYKMSTIGDGSTPLATVGAADGYLDYSFAANSNNTKKDGLVKLQVIWNVGDAPEYFTIDINGLQICTDSTCSIPPTATVTHNETAKTITYTFSELMQLTNNDGSAIQGTITSKLAVYQVIGLDYSTASLVPDITITDASLVGKVLTITYTGTLVDQTNVKYIVDAWGYKISDLAGNKMLPAESAMFTVTGVDTIAPSVNFVNPTPGNESYVKGTITGQVSATDAVGMGSYYIRVWKNAFESGTLVKECSSAPGGNLLGTSQNVTCSLPTLPDGKYVFSAQFLDSSSHWGTAFRTFYIDNTVPTATIDGVTPKAIYNGSTNINVHAIDDNYLKTDLYIGDGASSFKTYTDVYFGLSWLGDGNYRMVVIDKAGNSTEYIFTIDKTAPTITLGTYTTAPTNQNITVTATTEAGSTLNVGSTTFTANGSFDFIATDAAGNTTTETVTITNIDKTAPNTPVHSSPSNYAYINYNDFWFVWEGVGDAVSYEIQNSTNPSVDGNNSFTNVMWTGDYQNIQPTISKAHSVGANGTWYWQVRAVDSAGNKSAWSTPWKVTIDKTAPTVTKVDTTHANGAFKIGEVVDFIVTYSEPVTVIGSPLIPLNSFGIANYFSGSGTDTLTFRYTVDTGENSSDLDYESGIDGGSIKDAALNNANNLPAIGTFAAAHAIVIDTVAPTISGAVSAGTTGSNGWYTSNVTVHFACSDTGGSGIASCPTDQILSIEGSSVSSTAQTATDNAGNNSASSNVVTVKIDKTVPFKPSVTKPVDNGYIISATTQKFVWTSSTDSTPGSGLAATDKYQYQIDNNSDYTSPERDVSLNTTTRTLTNPLSDGIYYIHVRAKDAAGNYSLWSDSVKFTIDTEAPQFNTKTEFSDWYNTSVTSTFNYTDTNGVVSGNNPTCDITTQGENQTCTIVSPNVCDAAGNCNTTTATSNGANLDFTAPTSTIDGGPNNGTIYSSTWNGFISGTASDLTSGVKEVQLTVQKTDGQYWTGSTWQVGETPVVTSGTTNWTYQIGATLADGTYTIKSHAIDNAGNTENTYTLTIILDKTIDEVSISLDPAVGDASNGWYKTQPTITLTSTDANFDKIQYQWDSQTGTWTDYNATPFKLTSEGAHVLYYRAIDKAQNISTVGVKNIAWDQTDLEYGPQNITADPNPTSGSTSKIKWDFAKDNTGIDKYEVQWSLSGLNYSKTVGAGTTEADIDQLTEGSWTVKVVAFDASGRSKDNSINVVVDRSGPVAPVLTLAGTGVGTATLSWNTIADATDYIVWYGNAPGSRLYGARVGNVTSYTVRSLGAGNYYFIVKAVDAAQNQGTESNEVSTGTIAGATGVEEGAVAEGFTPEVMGTSTEATPTATPTTGANQGILGTSTNNQSYWWLLLIPLSFGAWLILKKK